MKIAFVFPGQGSQSVGMLDSFAGEPAVAQVLDEASAALGQDLAALIKRGPAESLSLTVNTQPVMLAAGYAVYRAWRAAGGAEPAIVAGHSLGEYTALTAAGALGACRCREARAHSRAGDAGRGAGRAGRHGGHPRAVRRPGAPGVRWKRPQGKSSKQ